jgi:hypothetical protein
MGAAGESGRAVLPGGGSVPDGRGGDDARFDGLPQGVGVLFAGQVY